MIDEKIVFRNMLPNISNELLEYLWNNGYRNVGTNMSEINKLISESGDKHYYENFVISGNVKKKCETSIDISKALVYETAKIPVYDNDIDLQKDDNINATIERIFDESNFVLYEMIHINNQLTSLTDYSKENAVIITTNKGSKCYTVEEYRLLNNPAYKDAIIPEIMKNENDNKTIIQMHESFISQFNGKQK